MNISYKVHVQQWSFVNAVEPVSKGNKHILNYAEERNATLLQGHGEDEAVVQRKTRVTVQELPLQ